MANTTVDTINLQIKSSSKRAANGIRDLAEALKTLNDVGGEKTKRTVTQLERLKTAITGMNGKDAAKGISKLTQSLNGLNNASAKGGGFGKFSSGFKEFLSGTFGVRLGLAGLGQAFSSAITETNDYIETTNYAAQVLGNFYPQAKQYAERIQDLMGVDSKDFLEAQTSFMTMAQGFGLAAQKSYDLSKGLTELGYDISSITNTDTETVFQRLQSAIAGEIEPVRRWGVALDQASMKEWLMKKGLDSNVSSMNQASKALIRYNMLVETMNKNGVIGDMARTMSSPANAIRILKQQITQLARAFGQVLLPAISFVLPYIQAFVSVLTKAIRAIAGFFGITLPDWSKDDSAVVDLNTNLEDTNDNLGDATKKAKEFKKQLMGFDELNIINVPGETSTSPTTNNTPTTGADLGLDVPDVWNESTFAQIKNKVKELEGPMTVILGLATSIGTALLGWKIKQALTKHFAMPPEPGTFMYGITTLANMVTTNPLFSKGLAATMFKGNPLATVTAFTGGIVLLVAGFVDLVTNNEKFKEGLKALKTILGTVKKKIQEFLEGLGIEIDLTSLKTLSQTLNEATDGWISLGDAAVIFGALLIGGGPLALAIGGIVALIKGLGWAFEEVEDSTGKKMPRYKAYWSDFKTELGSGWEAAKTKVKEGFQGVVDNIKKHFEGNEALDADVIQRFKDIKDSIAEGWENVKTKVSTGVENAVKGAKEKLEGAKETIGNAWNTATEKIKDKTAEMKAKVGTKWGDIKDKWAGITDNIKNKTAEMKAKIGTKLEDFKKNWKLRADVVKDKTATMKAKIGTKASELKKAWDNLVGKLKDKTLNIGLKFSAAAQDLKEWVNTNVIDKVNNKFKDVPILKNHLIPHIYATGGFPEEGPFFMNRGEIAGKFSNGKGVVANNMQIIEGISRGVQDGIMAGYRYANVSAPSVNYSASSLAEQMTTNGQNRDQNITVTLNVDGQEMARKVFKVHNSTVKQTGRSPLMI